ncbi:MAG: 50S ribosomal protein L7/L12 [Candidatus Margulisbacteria bacterium]|nr:50S ribosomal protein L7/L12 [Candidatus Margulisiibacteriota bacterium]
MTEATEVKLSESAQKVIESIEKMTVIELNDLVKAIESKFNVSAAAPVMMAAAGAGGGEAAEVSDSVNVILASAGAKKIQVLKIIREVTGLGLKEAKELVDGAPKTVKEGVKKAEAEDIKKKIEAEGGKIEIK